MVKIDQEKVKLGKVLVELDLERRIIEGGILPLSPPDERASVVRGIISGLLKKGSCEYALHLVYGNGTINALFDGAFADFKQEFIKSLKREERWGCGIRVLLSRQWAPDELYQLATQTTVPKEEALNILSELANNKQITEEQKQKAFNIWAEYMLQKGNPYRAYELFSKAENKERIAQLYTNLLENISKTNLDTLVYVAQDDSENKRSRLTTICRKVLADKKLQSAEIQYSKIGKFLHKYVDDMDLSKEESDALTALAAEQMTHYDIERNTEPKLKQAWALTHIAEEPKDAYRILKELNYKGSELLVAARTYLRDQANTHNLREAIAEIPGKILLQLYEEMPLDVRIGIATHLNDKKTLQELSKEVHVTKRDEYDAYNLWILGGGSYTDSYVRELRKTMLEKRIKESKEGKRKGVWTSLGEYDREGHIEAYDALVEDFPETAYGLASHIKDEERKQKAREYMVRESPRDALRKFEVCKDNTGIAMATATLAEQYKVNKDDLARLIQLPEEKKA